MRGPGVRTARLRARGAAPAAGPGGRAGRYGAGGGATGRWSALGGAVEGGGLVIGLGRHARAGGAGQCTHAARGLAPAGVRLGHGRGHRLRRGHRRLGGADLAPGAGAVVGAGYTGVVTTAVAYLAFAWGARRLSPTAAGVGILVEPLVAAWLAAWWLGETLGPGQWAGALLLGVAILSVPRRS
ncbi:DMT family transporter [Paenacidovorax monticola]|uniref:DMT family transporter n=1 Tax=Paenacidovorax monticola TaxID=1926868 RepID=UPI00336A2913